MIASSRPTWTTSDLVSERKKKIKKEKEELKEGVVAKKEKLEPGFGRIFLLSYHGGGWSRRISMNLKPAGTT